MQRKNEFKQEDTTPPDYVVSDHSLSVFEMADIYAQNELKTVKSSPKGKFNTVFEEDKSLLTFFNQSKKIVDIGIGVGIEVLGFKQQNWEVVGYDFVPSALEYLSSQSVVTRAVDLNAIDSKSRQLSYYPQLQSDLSSSCNILALKTLHYLEPQAMKLLMFALLDEAKPGSVYFFDNHTHSVKEEKNAHIVDQMNGKCLLPKNYVASFFAPRTDIEFLRLKHQPMKAASLPDVADYYEEFVVLRKR